MGQILRDIYSDSSIAPLLGFKGGTCAYFFYNLPRFSVDLDFDLFDSSEATKKIVFEKVEKILVKYGTIKDRHTKFYTVFFLLSYGTEDRNIKVEINVRPEARDSARYYAPKDYLGIPMLIPSPEYMFACKLVALTERPETAMRDIYDVHYFAKNNWEFDIEVIEKRTNQSVADQLTKCIDTIAKVKDNEIMQGLGELVDEKAKVWVKKHLRAETIFLLKNYLAAITRQ